MSDYPKPHVDDEWTQDIAEDYSRREHQQKHQVHEQGAEELCSEVFDLRSPT